VTHEQDPPRWGAATNGLPESLVVGLEEARGVLPGADRLARMRSGLAPLLTVSAVASLGAVVPGSTAAQAAISGSGTIAGKTAVSGPAGLSSKLLVPWVLVGGVVAATVGGVVAIRSTQVSETPSASRARSAMPSSAMPSSAMPSSAMPSSAMPSSAMPSSAMPSSAMPSSALGPELSQERTQEVAVPKRPLVHPPSAVAEPAREAGSLHSEARLLAQARAQLTTDPRATLGACEQHQREFSRGVLSQEREVLAVEALVRLGRTAEAQARVARFRAKFSGSPHLPRLEALVSTQQPLKQ